MGVEVTENLRLGEGRIGVAYRRIGNLGTSMDPTVSRAMDDRDRMDWLERSITSIRKVLADHGIQIQDLESGHGRVMGRIGDIQATAENHRLEGIARGDETRRAMSDSNQANGVAFADLADALNGIRSETHEVAVLAASTAQEVKGIEYLGKAIEALIGRIGGLEDSVRQTTEALTVIQARKPWWRFWSK